MIEASSRFSRNWERPSDNPIVWCLLTAVAVKWIDHRSRMERSKELVTRTIRSNLTSASREAQINMWRGSSRWRKHEAWRA